MDKGTDLRENLGVAMGRRWAEEQSPSSSFGILPPKQTQHVPGSTRTIFLSGGEHQVHFWKSDAIPGPGRSFHLPRGNAGLGKRFPLPGVGDGNALAPTGGGLANSERNLKYPYIGKSFR